MAHGLIAATDLDGILDHIAYVWINKALLGPAGYPLGTAIDALNNLDLAAVNLADAGRQVDTKAAAAAWYDTLYQDLFNKITNHLQADGVTTTAKDVYDSLDEYLTGEALRVHTAFASAWYANMGTRLSKANVFDASGLILGTIDWSGSGTGALTDGVSTDKTYTGGNGLRWRIPTGKSVTSSSVTLNLELSDGTNEEKTVTIVGAAGATGDIGTPATDWYVDLDSITVNSGGANGNQAVIETVCDRNPALLS